MQRRPCIGLVGAMVSVAQCVAESCGRLHRRGHDQLRASRFKEDRFLGRLGNRAATAGRATSPRSPVIDALAEKTRQVEAHLDAAERDAEHLLALRFRDAIADAPLRADGGEWRRLIRRERWPSTWMASYHRAGRAASFGKGTFHQAATVAGSAFTSATKRLYSVEDPVTCCLQQRLGVGAVRLLIAQPEDAGPLSASHRMHDLCQARPGADGCSRVPGATTSGRMKGLPKICARPRPVRRRAQPDLWLPGPSWMAIRGARAARWRSSKSFDRLQAEVAALRAQHAALRAANAALLPATLERVFTQ
jgi:type I restriction enzyme S subunit